MNKYFYLLFFSGITFFGYNQTTLQQKVLDHYKCRFINNKLKTVKNGIEKKCNKKNSIYIALSSEKFTSIKSYYGKYPEFLVDSIKKNSCDNKSTSINNFKKIGLRKFFKTKKSLTTGDFHITIGNSIKKGAFYFVQTIEVVPDKNFFHSKTTTYKFNLKYEFIDYSSWNYYQCGYSKKERFINDNLK